MAQSLFDEYGRRIPPELASPVHKTIRRYFLCVQPELNYAESHKRIQESLKTGDALSAADFETRAKAILDKLAADPATANIVKGVHVPFFLPKADYPDYGLALQDTYLPAVAHAYKMALPKYDFVDHNKVDLKGKLNPAPGSRHETLLAAMKNGPVVGYYFPALSEYSVPAALEQMATLPSNFLLAGGFDTAAAFMGSPSLLMRTDGYPPLLWLSALTTEKAEIGYHFEAYGYNLNFNRRTHLGHVAEYWWHGLVVLG